MAAFYNGSSAKLDSISKVLSRFGLNRNKPSNHGSNCYALWYCGGSSKKLYDVLYENPVIYGDRKKKRFEELLLSSRLLVNNCERTTSFGQG